MDTKFFVSLAILFVALGLGIYVLIVLKKSDVPQTRKMNMALIGLALLGANVSLLNDICNITGIASMALLVGFSTLLQSLIKERKADIAQGKIASPTPQQLKRSFWLSIGGALLGIAIVDVILAFQDTGSISILFITNIFTVTIVFVVLWIQRRKFFPKPDSVTEQKSQETLKQ